MDLNAPMTESEKKVADSFKAKFLKELTGLGCIDIVRVQELIKDTNVRFQKDKESEYLGYNIGNEICNRFVLFFPKGIYISLSNHELVHDFVNIEGLDCLLQRKLDYANGRKWCRVGYRPWYKRQAKEYKNIIKLAGEKEFWDCVLTHPKVNNAIGELFISKQNVISWRDFREVSDHLFYENRGLFSNKLSRQVISGLKYIAQNPMLKADKPDKKLLKIQSLFKEAADRIRAVPTKGEPMCLKIGGPMPTEDAKLTEIQNRLPVPLSPSPLFHSKAEKVNENIGIQNTSKLSNGGASGAVGGER